MLLWQKTLYAAIQKAVGGPINVEQFGQLFSSDGNQGDQFGFAVAISDDGLTAAVGASSKESGTATNAGAVYIFVQSGGGWIEQAKLVSPTPSASDFFGRTLSISSDGTTLLVGAPNEDTGATDTGAAYVYTRSGTTWTQQTTLLATDRQASNFFGFSVALSADGNLAVIGSHGGDYGTADGGCGYVFVRTGTSWSNNGKLYAIDREASENLGYSVAVSADGSTIIAGAPYDDAGTISDCGRVCVFRRVEATWTHIATIQPSIKTSNAHFGWSLAVSADGSTFVVGARRASNVGVDSGAAYVYELVNGTWAEQAILLGNDTAAYDYLGTTVAITGDGNKIAVGAPYHDSPIATCGTVYVFTRQGTVWTQASKVTPSDPKTNTLFGQSVDLTADGATLFVGANGYDTTVSDVGCAYIFV